MSLGPPPLINRLAVEAILAADPEPGDPVSLDYAIERAFVDAQVIAQFDHGQHRRKVGLHSFRLARHKATI